MKCFVPGDLFNSEGGNFFNFFNFFNEKKRSVPVCPADFVAETRTNLIIAALYSRSWVTVVIILYINAHTGKLNIHLDALKLVTRSMEK